MYATPTRQPRQPINRTVRTVGPVRAFRPSAQPTVQVVQWECFGWSRFAWAALGACVPSAVLLAVYIAGGL